mgnify:CR=1 FL=1
MESSWRASRAQEAPRAFHRALAFREVAGEAAYYFGGTESEELAESVLAWLVFNEQGNAPSPTNMKWNTWAESAAQLVESLNLEGAPHTPDHQVAQAC